MSQRRLILSDANLRPVVEDIVRGVLEGLVESYTSSDEEEWDLAGLHTVIDRMIHLPAEASAEAWGKMSTDEIVEQVFDALEASYDTRTEQLGADMMHQIERIILLRAIDNRWVRHLTALDELREGIGLRAVGQRNPLVEYKREAFSAFEQLQQEIQNDVANRILNVRIEARPAAPRPMRYSGADTGAAAPAKAQRHGQKVGRNDPCPCGSGKKYKACCLLKGLSPEEAAAQGRAQAVTASRH